LKRRIIGLQIHHSVQLDDAMRGAANMCAGLRAALTCTGDPDHAQLLEDASALARRIAAARSEASLRLRGFYEADPERFKRFQAFLNRHLSVLFDAANRSFQKKGPGALIYRAPDDRHVESHRRSIWPEHTATYV